MPIAAASRRDADFITPPDDAATPPPLVATFRCSRAILRRVGVAAMLPFSPLRTQHRGKRAADARADARAMLCAIRMLFTLLDARCREHACAIRR